MRYSQLIQMKRVKEKAFIFLNASQLMLGVLGIFSSFWVSDKLGLSGMPSWTCAIFLGLVGVALGGIYFGLYGYQYLILLARSLRNYGQSVNPKDLYHREFEHDISYVLGGSDGQAQVYHQGSAAKSRTVTRVDGAIVYRVSPVDLSQYAPTMVTGLLQRWGGFWAGARPPMRIITHSTPFQAAQVVEQVKREALMAEEAWRARALSIYGRFLDELTRKAAMYQAHHEVVLWADSETEAHATIGSLTGFLGVSAAPTEMMPLLDGEYEVAVDHLRPLDPTKPYIILMVSHEFSGEWTWSEPLVTILRQPFSVSVAIDVDQNLAPNKALDKLVQYENVVLDILNNDKTGRNPKAEGALRDIQLALAKANSGQALHFSTVVVAVKGLSLTEAKKNAETVRTLTAARLALVTIPGGQGELLKFFSPTKRKAINLPEISHNVTSDGMATLSGPLGFRRRNATNGIFWGIGSSGGSDTYPIWWNGYGDDPDRPAAYHGLFLGMSGYGKTVAMNALCYREALRGTQVIMMEPMGHAKRLVDLIGPDGASYNPLSLRQMQLNPLDPISDNINEQKAFQISLYRLMLKQIDPNRNLTMQEAGLLDAALSKVYDGVDDPLNTPPDRLPVLEQLTYYLKQLGAKTLGQELELNYVSGSLGSVYNQPTNLDVGLEADCVTYDFRDIPKSAWPLIYTLVLGRIQRVIRVRGRDRRRVIAIDEFGWLSQEPMLAETVAMWFKTFRTFGCGIWLAEQELARLIGGGHAGGDLSGHAFIGNSTFQLFFHHESAAAEQVVNTYPNVQPYKGALETFGRPQETGVAEAILRIPDGAYHTYMLLAPTEQRLIGS